MTFVKKLIGATLYIGLTFADFRMYITETNGNVKALGLTLGVLMAVCFLDTLNQWRKEGER